MVFFIHADVWVYPIGVRSGSPRPPLVISCICTDTRINAIFYTYCLSPAVYLLFFCCRILGANEAVHFVRPFCHTQDRPPTRNSSDSVSILTLGTATWKIYIYWSPSCEEGVRSHSFTDDPFKVIGATPFGQQPPG